MSLKNLSSKAVVAFLVAIVTLINSASVIFGFNPIPISEDMIYAIVSAIVPFLAIIPVAYKNYNVSDASIQGQEVTDAIKSQGKVVCEIEEDYDEKNDVEEEDEQEVE